MTTSAAAFARHDLLTVAPQDWSAVGATQAQRPVLSEEAAALVMHWGHMGRPVIVRRPMPSVRAGHVSVGLPLPPFVGKGRVAMVIPPDIKIQRVAAVPLRMAQSVAPETWRETIKSVVALGESVDVVPNVFGSLLWQVLTGLPYLHVASDLDLLWPIADPVSIGTLLDGLARVDEVAAMRIDGEIITGLGAVNWRELDAARRGEVNVVMVKSLERAAFVAAVDLLAPAAASCR